MGRPADHRGIGRPPLKNLLTASKMRFLASPTFLGAQPRSEHRDRRERPATGDNRKNQIRKPPTTWRDTIDGWINDPTIRQHFLIALGMVLITVVAAISIATSLLGILLASGTLGAGSTWWLRRRRHRPDRRN